MGLFLRGGSSSNIGIHTKTSLEKDVENFQKELLKSDDAQKEFERLGKLINSIFMKAFGIKYKFTYEDLKLEAFEKAQNEETRETIGKLCDTLNEMEFDKNQITKEKLLTASEKTMQLIDLVYSHKDIIKSNKETVDLILKKEPEHLPAFVVGNVPKVEIPLVKDPIIKNKKTAKEEKKNAKQIPSIKNKKVTLEKTSEIKLPAPLIESIPVPKKEEKKASVEDTLAILKPETNKMTQGFFSGLFNKKENAEIGLPPPPSFKNNLDKPLPLPPPFVEKTEAKQSKDIKKTSVHAFDLKTQDPTLPKFETLQIIQKQKTIESNLAEIVRNLESNKKYVSEEIGLIEQERKVLKKEQKKVKSITPKHDELPAFKIFEKNLDKEIIELDKKRKELLVKEAEIEEKLGSASKMEKHLKEYSKRLSNDEAELKKRAEFLEEKEKIVEDIKKQLDEKYNHAISEIDNVKKDLKEKEESFMKLQTFYQARENRLSVEETNLLDEQRKNSKLVFGLLGKHMKIANSDLEKTSEKIEALKEKSKLADEKIKGYEKKFDALLEEKDTIKKEIDSKRKYFDKLEKDFREKDPEFNELEKLLDSRAQNIAKKEETLIKFEEALSKGKEEARNKHQIFDLKEVDLKSIEREINRLKFDTGNKESKIRLMEHHIKHRIESYESIKKEIFGKISLEKKDISRIEKKLTKKGYLINKGLNEAAKTGKVYDSYHNNILKIANSLGEGEEARIDEITISDGIQAPGNPSILDVLRLLNIGKDFLANHQTDRARDAYLEIQRIFDDLDQEDKEEIYPQVMKVFKKKSMFMPSYESEKVMSHSNIDTLMQQFQLYLDSGDIRNSEEVYSMLQQKYVDLPREEKARYYPRLMELYNRILEHQVTLGVSY